MRTNKNSEDFKVDQKTVNKPNIPREEKNVPCFLNLVRSGLMIVGWDDLET